MGYVKYFRLSHFLVGESRVPGGMQIHVREFFLKNPFFYLRQYTVSLVISLCHGITKTSKLGFPNLRLALGPKKYLLYLSINWKVPTRMPSHHRQSGPDFAVVVLRPKNCNIFAKGQVTRRKKPDFPLRTGDFQADVLECQNFKG